MGKVRGITKIKLCMTFYGHICSTCMNKTGLICAQGRPLSLTVLTVVHACYCDEYNRIYYVTRIL